MKTPLGKSYSSFRSIALLALAAITPLVLLATLVNPYYQRDEQHQLDEQLQRAAERAALAISRELQTETQLLAMLAESPRLDAPIDAQGFVLLADRLRNRLTEWSSIRVSDPGGNILVVSPPPPAPTATVVDPGSHRQVVETKTPIVGEMMAGPGGNAGFAVRVPVIRDDKVIYVLSTVIRPAALEHALDGTSLPPLWVSRILDRNGRVIAGKPTAADGPTVSSATGTSWAEGLDSGAYRTSYARIEGLDWRVAIGMPLDAYKASEKLGFWIVLSSALIAAALASLGAILLRRELVHRREQAEIVANSQRFDALSKLAGGLSHDFNNLLMGFQAGLDQLSRRRTDEARFLQVVGLMRESLERAKTSVQRLSGFTRRSDTGSEVLRLQERFDDLAALIAQTVRDDIVLDREFDVHAWPIRVDPQALEIALVNLAANAQDAMPNGGRLKLTVRNVERAERMAKSVRGPHVHISLSDTGSGIEPENIGRVFDPFFTTKGSASAGLGLSQVYSFVRRFGGTAFAASVPGTGTAIHLLLPAAQDDFAAAQTRPRLPAPGQKVLIVDDDPVVAQGVAAFLEGSVALVDTAQSGAEGLAKLKAQPFDTLVTDITMPGLSGLEFAAQARELQPDLHILLMTGYSDQLEKGAKSPFRVLAKPFARETLLEAISAGTVGDNVVPLDRRR